jgi:hypothetical protein
MMVAVYLAKILSCGRVFYHVNSRPENIEVVGQGQDYVLQVQKGKRGKGKGKYR